MEKNLFKFTIVWLFRTGQRDWSMIPGRDVIRCVYLQFHITLFFFFVSRFPPHIAHGMMSTWKFIHNNSSRCDQLRSAKWNWKSSWRQASDDDDESIEMESKRRNVEVCRVSCWQLTAYYRVDKRARDLKLLQISAHELCESVNLYHFDKRARMWVIYQLGSVKDNINFSWIECYFSKSLYDGKED